jgi:hypothetical protein
MGLQKKLENKESDYIYLYPLWLVRVPFAPYPSAGVLLSVAISHRHNSEQILYSYW